MEHRVPGSGRDGVVERAVGERQRAAQVGHPQVRAVTAPPPGQLQHPGALVDPGDDGAPVAQRREQRPSRGPRRGSAGCPGRGEAGHERVFLRAVP